MTSFLLFQIETYKFSNNVPTSGFKPGKFLKIRTFFLSSREYKQKGLCLFVRSKHIYSSQTFCIRSRPFSCDMILSSYNPYLKIYVVGDGIRTHGYFR
jgi:hypothetical protein